MAVGEDYQGLTEALLDAHTPGGWDQPPAVYGVLTADQLHTVAPTLTPHAPGTLVAVRIPDPNAPRPCTVYHPLACLDLTGWHGAMVVHEALVHHGANGRTEVRRLQYAATDGTDSAAMRRRIRRGESPTEYAASGAGAVRDFLRATVGRRFQPPLLVLVAQTLVTRFVSGDLDGLYANLTNPALTDDQVVQRLGFTDGVPGHLVPALFSTLVGTVGDIVSSLLQGGNDIAVTPDLVGWLGMDFFRLGASQLVDWDFLVRATWTVLEVANPDSAPGTLVRRRLAQVDQESSATVDECIADRLVADPAFTATALAAILFGPEGTHWVTEASQDGQTATVRSFLRALRTLFYACDPASPELPLLAHRIGVLADAADGTRPATEAPAGRA